MTLEILKAKLAEKRAATQVRSDALSKAEVERREKELALNAIRAWCTNERDELRKYEAAKVEHKQEQDRIQSQFLSQGRIPPERKQFRPVREPALLADIEAREALIPGVEQEFLEAQARFDACRQMPVGEELTAYAGFLKQEGEHWTTRVSELRTRRGQIERQLRTSRDAQEVIALRRELADLPVELVIAELNQKECVRLWWETGCGNPRRDCIDGFAVVGKVSAEIAELEAQLFSLANGREVRSLIGVPR